MNKQIGFIFLFSNQIPLKPFSQNQKLKYKNKILVHSLSLLNFVKTLNDTTKQKCSLLFKYDRNQSINQILKSEFGIKSAYIIDYNPLPKKFIEDKNTLVYCVLLDNTKKQKIINQISEKICQKIIDDKMILFYSLDSILPEYPDIFTSINNYYKTKKIQLNKRSISFINSDNEIKLFITLDDIVESLCGVEELREETKCYI